MSNSPDEHASGITIFDDHEDVAERTPRVIPVLAALVGIGLAFGGIGAVLATGGTDLWATITANSRSAEKPVEARPEVASVEQLERSVGVELPEGAAVETPRDESDSVEGQVRLPAGASIDEVSAVLRESGFVAEPSVPIEHSALWGDSLENATFWAADDGRSALAGENDGRIVIVFSRS